MQKAIEIFSLPEEKIWVYEMNNKRYLTFSQDLSLHQSCIDLLETHKLVFEYQKIMISGLYLNPNPESILMIGLGGGTMITALSSILPNIKIDIVEMNARVLEIAEKYFYFKQTDNINIFIDNGFDFVCSSTNKYDYILIDVFSTNYIPREFISQRFVSSLKKLTLKHTVITVNTFLNSQYYSIENDLYYSNFGEFHDIICKNRIIMIGPKLSLSNIEINADTFYEKFSIIGIDKQFILEKFKMQKSTISL